MKINDGYTEIDIEDIESLLFRSKNSLLSINLTENDPVYGANILFALNDERLNHDQLAGLNEDDHRQYLDQVRHLAAHGGSIEGGKKSLNELLDVQIVDPQNKQVLKYNGTFWKNDVMSHAELTDKDADDHTQYLTVARHDDVELHNYYDDEEETGNVPHDYLLKLQDVNAEDIKNGQTLKKQGDFFVPADFPTFDANHKHNSDYLRLDGTNSPLTDINFNGNRVTNLGEAEESTDAITKGEFDSLLWKNPVDDIVVEIPLNPIEGSRYAISHLAEDESIRGAIIEYTDDSWTAYAPIPGIAFYNIDDKKPYYWNGTTYVAFGTGTGGSGASRFFDLSDVVATDPQVGDIFCVNANGELENKPAWMFPPDERYVTIPQVEVGREFHVMFSDGSNGTFTNGIRTNRFKQLDMDNNRMRNAVIDCGAYYG